QGVLLDLAAAPLRELVHRKGTKLDAVCMGARFDGISVVNNRGARRHQSQVPVHGILIERNQEIEAIAEACHFLNPRANREQRMPAPNDRLIGVVSIQVEPTPSENLGKDVSRCGHTLTCGPSNRNSESPVHKYSPFSWWLWRCLAETRKVISTF